MTLASLDLLISEGGSLIQTGAPSIVVANGSDGEKRLIVKYTRLKNGAKLGVGYRVQFSDDLVKWDDATTPASLLASNAAFEAVAVADSVSTEEAPADLPAFW